MTKPTIFICLLLLLIACQRNGDNSITTKQIEQATYSPEKIKAGDTITVSYPTADLEEGEWKVYYKHDANWYAAGLEGKSTDSLTQVQYHVPDSAKALVMTFPTFKKRKGIHIPLYKADDASITNSIEAKFFEMSVGSFQELEMLNPVKENWKDLMSPFSEIDSLKLEYESRIAYFWNKDEPDSFDQYVDDRIDAFAKAEKLTEDEYSNWATFLDIRQQQNTADSLRIAAASIYPNGEIAKQATYSTYFNSADQKAKDSIYEIFTKKGWTDGYRYSFMSEQQAAAALKNKETVKYMELINRLDDFRKASAMNNNAYNLAEKDEFLEFAKIISARAVELTKKVNPAFKETFPDLTAKEIESQQKYQFANNLDTYAYVLHKLGDNKNAVIAQRKSIESAPSPGFYEKLLFYLDKEDRYEDIMRYGKKGWHDVGTTSKSKELIEKASSKLDIDYQELAAFIEKRRATKNYTSTKESMINEELSGFDVVDVDGKTVSNSDLKGKIVIMDFWATWCGPCVASFPAMAKAQEEMKDDNVMFVFVNTMEDKSATEVATFLEKRDLDFYTVLDRSEKRQKTFADNMGINAIPTKVVLDENGRVRFKDIGWSGSDDQLLEKLKTQVKLIQEEKEAI